MEKENNQIIEKHTNQIDTPTTTHAQKPPKFFMGILVGIILLLLITVMGMGIYIMQANKTNTDNKMTTKITPEKMRSPLNTPRVTPSPTATPTPDPEIARWKLIKTSFAELKVPQDWDMWDCGKDYYVIFKKNPQPAEFAKSCPFGGNAGEMHIGKLTTPFASLESSIPKSEVVKNDGSDGSEPYTSTTTISNVALGKIDNKTSAQWKEIRSGGLMGDGTNQIVHIMPNIQISLMNYANLTMFEKILSTIKWID